MPSQDNICRTHGVVYGIESSRLSGLYGCVYILFFCQFRCIIIIIIILGV
jgi:hypothetical protein